MSELCGRCGKPGACGAAGLCYACNDVADAQERGEPETCVRWGAGPDRCVLGFDHLGPCRDADGNTTATIAREFRRQMRDWRNDSGV